MFQRSTHKERQRQKSAHTHTLTHRHTHTRGERERQREREESHRPPGRAEQHDLPTDCPPAVCCKQSSPSPRIPKSWPPHLLLLLLLIPSSHCSLLLLELLLPQLQILLLLVQLLRLLDVFSPLPKKLQILSFCVETLLQMRCNGRAARWDLFVNDAAKSVGRKQTEGEEQGRKVKEMRVKETKPSQTQPNPT